MNVGLLLAKRARWIGTVLRARPIEEKIADHPAVRRRGAAAVHDGSLRPVIDRRFPLERSPTPTGTWRPTPTSARSSLDVQAAGDGAPAPGRVTTHRLTAAPPTMVTSTSTATGYSAPSTGPVRPARRPSTQTCAAPAVREPSDERRAGQGPHPCRHPDDHPPPRRGDAGGHRPRPAGDQPPNRLGTFGTRRRPGRCRRRCGRPDGPWRCPR